MSRGRGSPVLRLRKTVFCRYGTGTIPTFMNKRLSTFAKSAEEAPPKKEPRGIPRHFWPHGQGNHPHAVSKNQGETLNLYPALHFFPLPPKLLMCRYQQDLGEIADSPPCLLRKRCEGSLIPPPLFLLLLPPPDPQANNAAAAKRRSASALPPFTIAALPHVHRMAIDKRQRDMFRHSRPLSRIGGESFSFAFMPRYLLRRYTGCGVACNWPHVLFGFPHILSPAKKPSPPSSTLWPLTSNDVSRVAQQKRFPATLC